MGAILDAELGTHAEKGQYQSPEPNYTVVDSSLTMPKDTSRTIDMPTALDASSSRCRIDRRYAEFEARTFYRGHANARRDTKVNLFSHFSFLKIRAAPLDAFQRYTIIEAHSDGLSIP